jgi:hypothetical protein
MQLQTSRRDRRHLDAQAPRLRIDSPDPSKRASGCAPDVIALPPEVGVLLPGRGTSRSAGAPRGRSGAASHKWISADCKPLPPVMVAAQPVAHVGITQGQPQDSFLRAKPSPSGPEARRIPQARPEPGIGRRLEGRRMEGTRRAAAPRNAPSIRAGCRREANRLARQ